MKYYGSAISRPVVDADHAPQSTRQADLQVVTPEERQPVPVPIWVAALFASRCKVTGNGKDHAVSWKSAGGRMLYTNSGSGIERIEPLGVNLEGGHTLAVTWVPGETAYTIKVFRQFDCCA